MPHNREPGPLPPETAYLFDLCARARGFALRDEHLAESASPIDWAAFLVAADRHKVTNTAYRAFCDELSPAPPQEILLTLKRSVAARTAIRATLLSEWRRISERFRSEGIEALVMKGPALSLQLFGDPMVREFRDIDLLADSRDTDKIHTIFNDLGYDYTPDIPAGDTTVQEFLLRGSRHHGYKKRTLPCFIEVHFSCDADIGLAPLEWSETLRLASRPAFDGIDFPTLRRDDHALLALIHGAHHGWCQFQWVLDAATLLTSPDVRLRLDSPGSWRGEDPRYALDAFVALYGRIFKSPSLKPCVTPMDRAIPEKRDAKRAVLLSNLAFGHLAVAGIDFSDSRVEQRHKALYLAMLRRGARRKIAYLATILRPTRDDFPALGERHFPIAAYYLIRPIRIAVKATRRAFGGGGAKK